MAQIVTRNGSQITDPPVSKFLFSDTRFAWIWLIVRLYLAYTWLESGFGKLTGTGWVDGGSALKGFWVNALKVDPKPVITFDWYRQFIQFMVDSQSYVWFGKLVATGEFLIGIALLLGAFTGIAAFFGGFMNWNFMMAGSASVNPMFFTLSVLLILAWKTAGYWGLDRYLLPLLGTPWKPGFAVNSRAPATSASVAE
ncbi:MAG: DoxX family protein [Chloroflexi bacterium]|nr:DoxX family protein [Chloroflexota bacterium]